VFEEANLAKYPARSDPKSEYDRRFKRLRRNCDLKPMQKTRSVASRTKPVNGTGMPFVTGTPKASPISPLKKQWSAPVSRIASKGALRW
jgi:hypothetical protein